MKGRLIVFALAVAAVMALPAQAGSGPADVSIRFLSQQSILDSGKVRVAITARHRVKTVLTGKVRVTDPAGSPQPVTDTRTIRLPKGTFNRGLHLTSAGRDLVEGCAPKEVIVDGTVKRPHRSEHELSTTGTMVIDTPNCAGHSAFTVDPDDPGKRANGTPRDYAASSLGTGPVNLALFACDKVHGAGATTSFDPAGGVADRGSPAGSISKVNGSATAGSPQTVAGVGQLANQVTFSVNGSDGCARPVVFRDANSNGSLDLNDLDRPTEDFGLGGEVSFEPIGVSPDDAPGCDFLDPSVCLYPWPNDRFTTPANTPTGKRLDLRGSSMPKNRLGLPIEPSDYNFSDGFSPGNMIIVKIPGLETQQAFENTGAVPVTDIARYQDADQPVVVINAETGERHPIFSEIDSNPADPSDVTLLIRPARNFDENTRYIVALRNLRDAGDDPIEAGRAFQLYRDGIVTSDPVIEARRDHYENLFDKLGQSGIDRDDLYLSWDFTVASHVGLAGRMLHIRNNAFAQLGDTDLADMEVDGNAPQYAIDSVEDFTPEQDSRIARRVKGHVTVPCYLDKPGCVGVASRFNLENGIPTQIGAGTPLANNMSVSFECQIPRAAVDGAEVDPARLSLYGHGLLGSYTEVESGNVEAMSNEHNFTFCSTDWAGMSQGDIPNVLFILQNLSLFPTLADRSQQGMLNFLYLGRLMIHPDGLASNAAFKFDKGSGPESAIDTSALFYDGNSQGGILGGGLTAVAPDYNRAVLGVPAMNYSTLLRRSVDFDAYAHGEFLGILDLEDIPPELEDTPLGLYDNYPNELERPLVLSLIQLLWDRSEANGYANHMTTDPLPNTPAHTVLLHEAFGDHQVANVATEVEARTIGAQVRAPVFDPGRSYEVDPAALIPHIGSFPFGGSALVIWDSGSPTPPIGNVPPRAGQDPHSHPRNTAAARLQKSEFLRIGGMLIDVCGLTPCYANGYAGIP